MAVQLDLGPVDPAVFPSLNPEEYEKKSTVWEVPGLGKVFEDELKAEGLTDTMRALLTCKSIQVFT